MAVGTSVVGPAIIEEAESTTVILPGDTVQLSKHGNLIISVAGTRMP